VISTCLDSNGILTVTLILKLITSHSPTPTLLVRAGSTDTQLLL